MTKYDEDLLLEFIDQNEELINEQRFDELFDHGNIILLNGYQVRYLQEMLNSEGINPLLSMKAIPTNYYFQSELKTIGIPGNINYIYAYAFDQAEVEELVLANPDIKIENRAFRLCDKIKKIYYNGTGEQWATSELDKHLIIDPAHKVIVICLKDNEVFHYPQDKGR